MATTQISRKAPTTLNPEERLIRPAGSTTGGESNQAVFADLSQAKMLKVDDEMAFVQQLIANYSEPGDDITKQFQAIKLRVEERQRESRLFLGVIGEFSSGKSTLVNCAHPRKPVAHGHLARDDSRGDAPLLRQCTHCQHTPVQKAAACSRHSLRREHLQRSQEVFFGPGARADARGSASADPAGDIGRGICKGRDPGRRGHAVEHAPPSAWSSSTRREPTPRIRGTPR